MSAETSPLPARAGPAATDAPAWRELEAVVDRLGHAARETRSSEDFYALLLGQCVASLAGCGGAVWLRAPEGPMRRVAEQSWSPGDDAHRAAHEAALNKVLAGGGVTTTALGQHDDNQPVRLLAAVPAPGDSNQAVAILEIIQHAGASPATYRGQERFLAAVCEIASEHHAFQELGTLRSVQGYYRQLFTFSRRIHQAIGTRATAYRIANEGRTVIGCDRLSVAVRRGRRSRLIATSGVKRIERRSSTVQQLEKLAEVARRFNEPILYADGTSDALPQVAELLEQYVDQSHARQVAFVPVRLPLEDDPRDKSTGEPEAVLIAEQFDAPSGALLRDHVVEVAQLAATALEQAARWDRLPLAWLLEPLGRLRDLFLPRHLAKTILVSAASAAVVAALVLVKTDFTIEATGTLQPSVRRNVFATRSGLVDELLVRHGDEVTPNTVLVRLRDPELDLELERIAGQVHTAVEQLDAVRAAKSGRAAGDLTALESYRLSAEERQLEQQLENLRGELDLLRQQRESLVIHSPLVGEVITWDVAGLLRARPVERGQTLMTVADLRAPWQLELDVADDRIGHVVDAQSKLGPALEVRYRLASDDTAEHQGHVTQIAQLAEPPTGEEAAPPAVRVNASLDEQPGFAQSADLRPGMTVRAQILCGQRSLGYVWLHDVWDTLLRWMTF